MKDLAGLGKIAKTATDVIRGAVSTLYLPTAIKNEGRARADVEAYRAVALAHAEVRAALVRDEGHAELAERAKQRFLFELKTQQESIDKIFQKAIDQSKKAPKEEGRDISEHWIYRLMINSKDVTDDEIQNIFAKLIVQQGSANKKPISYMTLDALRLFEPRHARYFEIFCKLFYVFGGVHCGMRDAGQWIGDEEFSELIELGMVYTSRVPEEARIRFRNFTINIDPSDPVRGGFDFIFGGTSHLSLRGIELSKALYPAVANMYWHAVPKDAGKKLYEKVLREFVPMDLQYQSFKDILDVIIGENECSLVISVHQWDMPYDQKPIAEFDGRWRILSSRPPNFYVPPYLRRFISEIK